MAYKTTTDKEVLREDFTNTSSSTSSNKLTTPVIIGIIVGSIALLALIKYLYDRYKSSSTNTQQ